MKPSLLAEAALTDLSDEQLGDFLLSMWESLKALEERKKADEYIERVSGELKVYVRDTYTTETKEIRGQLKAGRALAAARGLIWRAPEVK